MYKEMGWEEPPNDGRQGPRPRPRGLGDGVDRLMTLMAHSIHIINL